jgi:hypothetical protein
MEVGPVKARAARCPRLRAALPVFARQAPTVRTPGRALLSWGTTRVSRTMGSSAMAATRIAARATIASSTAAATDGARRVRRGPVRQRVRHPTGVSYPARRTATTRSCPAATIACCARVSEAVAALRGQRRASHTASDAPTATDLAHRSPKSGPSVASLALLLMGMAHRIAKRAPHGRNLALMTICLAPMTIYLAQITTRSPFFDARRAPITLKLAPCA